MWPLIASIAAPAIGGIIGNASAAADAEDSRKMRQKAIDQWSNISTPSVSDQSVSLQRFKNAGDLRPELEQTFQQGQTEMRSLNSDPILRQAQYQALGRLQDISNQGGMSAQDRDRQVQIQIENSRQEKAQRGAISQNMAARGLSGSGVDIAAHLQAQQSAANRNSEQSRSIQAMAQQRALQAMMSSGELAGHMQSQQYQQQAEAARAQDMINNFNSRNMQAVSGGNVDRMNQAQGYNLSNSQRVSEQNTNLANTEQMHNKNLYQQNFDNQTRIASGMSNQYHNMADAELMEAQRKRQMYSGIGQGIGQAATAYSIFGGKG